MKVEKEKAEEGSNAQCRLGLHCNATSDGRFDSRGLLHVLLLSKKAISRKRRERERESKRGKRYTKRRKRREKSKHKKRLVWCCCLRLVSFLAPTFLSSQLNLPFQIPCSSLPPLPLPRSWLCTSSLSSFSSLSPLLLSLAIPKVIITNHF